MGTLLKLRAHLRRFAAPGRTAWGPRDSLTLAAAVVSIGEVRRVGILFWDVVYVGTLFILLHCYKAAGKATAHPNGSI